MYFIESTYKIEKELRVQFPRLYIRLEDTLYLSIASLKGDVFLVEMPKMVSYSWGHI